MVSHSTCFDEGYSQREAQLEVNEAKKKAGILKPINVHTLRHTYATHLLDEGIDFLIIKISWGMNA